MKQLIHYIKKTLGRRKAAPRRHQQTLLRAAAARRVDAVEDYDSEEPTTRLSSAFIVVLILHIVAVGGIWLFNSIKAHRRASEPAPIAAANTKTTASKREQSAPASASPKKVAPANSVAARNTGVAIPTGTKAHVVQPGENITKIATTYGATVAEIEELNDLAKGATIHPNQILTVPAKAPAKTAPVMETAKLAATPKKTDSTVEAPKPTTNTPAAPEKPVLKSYTVKKGDTASSIARTFGVTVPEIQKLNGISDPGKLKPGQTLKVLTKKK